MTLVKPRPKAPETSWWADATSRADFYARAAEREIAMRGSLGDALVNQFLAERTPDRHVKTNGRWGRSSHEV